MTRGLPQREEWSHFREEEGHDVERVFAAQCDGIKDKMSAMVKLATGTGEVPDIAQPTAECQLTWPSRSTLVTW